MPFYCVWVKTKLGPRDPEKKKKKKWGSCVLSCGSRASFTVRKKKMKKFMTRHQFFSFSLAGKGGSFPSKTSDSLGTDHSERTRIKSWHGASRLKARLQWFWFQTKEICMASSWFNTQLLEKKKSRKVATLRRMKLHYWGNRLRSLRFVCVCVFHYRTPNPFMAPLVTLKPFLTKKQLFFHLHQSWITCLSGVSFWSTPWALSNS